MSLFDPMGFVSGVGASVVANLIQGGANLIAKDGMRMCVEKMIDVVKMEFSKGYPEINIDEVCLARRENVDAIYEWVVELNTISDKPKLNRRNYDDTDITDEQEAFIINIMQHHMRQDERLSNYTMYKIVADVYCGIGDAQLFKNSVYLAKKFIDQIQFMENALNKQFGIVLYENLRFDYNNLVLSEHGQSLAVCFYTLNEIYSRMNVVHKETMTNKQFNDPIESIVYFLKIICPDRTTEVGKDYDEIIRYVLKIIKENSVKSPEYYNSLGQIHISSECGDKTLYSKIMSELIVFNAKIVQLLKIIADNVDVERIDNEVIDLIDEHLFHRIRHQISEANRDIIKKIISEKVISDMDLAVAFGLDVEVIRERLYPLTSDLLRYTYTGGITTELSIRHSYIRMMKKYSFEFFGTEVM